MSAVLPKKRTSCSDQSFKNFLENNSDNRLYHLFIAGGGKLESEIPDLVRENGIEQFVTITGIFAAEDLPKFYSTFDSFLFPSLAEGFGFVLAEAMCSKLPIISSDLPVLKEISDGQVWFLKR
jgi:glycosyltransferase involved in cell wall biosynthesis